MVHARSLLMKETGNAKTQRVTDRRKDGAEDQDLGDIGEEEEKDMHDEDEEKKDQDQEEEKD